MKKYIYTSDIYGGTEMSFDSLEEMEEQIGESFDVELMERSGAIYNQDGEAVGEVRQI